MTERPARSFDVERSRTLLAELLGAEGLVMIEPQPLRPLASTIFARAVRYRREIAELVGASCDERADAGAECNFVPLGGPPLFIEHEGLRRRVIEKEGGLALRGTDVEFSADELERLALLEPARFSSHAVLRPIVQNALLPVVAQVLGPGEFAYQEELYRFHLSEIGAGRRMPIPWPRLSATIIDARSLATAARFGVDQREMFLPEEELLSRFRPEGRLAGAVREAATSAKNALEGIRPAALGLDETLERPLRKTLAAVRRAFGTFGDKVEAAEARVRGFAPEKLRRLAAWVRPGGLSQERVFGSVSLQLLDGDDVFSRLLEEVDIFDRRHRLIRLAEGVPKHDD